MQLFYDTTLPQKGIDVGSSIVLSPELSHHIVVVLRCEVGSVISICNGQGRLYECRVVEAVKKGTLVKVETVEDNFGRQIDTKITIAIAPTKSMDRVEWAVEKAVEIGATVIVPIISQRSERKSVNVDRLKRIARSAAEQSLKGFLPTIEEPQKFRDFVTTNPAGFIAHCNEGEKIRIPTSESQYVVMIGPEGDFSPEEVEFALKNDYKAITLGNARLRTETAAVCAVYQCTL